MGNYSTKKGHYVEFGKQVSSSVELALGQYLDNIK
jgi:hypothetical protein